MDNDTEILKQFGGFNVNDLNHTLRLNDDSLDEDRMVFNKSSYVDINDLSSVWLGNRFFSIFSVLIFNVSMQSSTPY